MSNNIDFTASLNNIFTDVTESALRGAEQGFWTGVGSIPEVQQGIEQAGLAQARKYEPLVIIGLIILVVLLLVKGE